MRTYSTDVSLSCACAVCRGREVRVTLRKLKGLSRLESPAYEQAVHKIVSTR